MSIINEMTVDEKRIYDRFVQLVAWLGPRADSGDQDAVQRLCQATRDKDRLLRKISARLELPFLKPISIHGGFVYVEE